MSNKIFSELKKRHEEIKADYAIAADNSTHWTRLAGRRLGEMIALEKAMAAIAQIGALLDPQPEAASPEFASDQGAALEEMIETSDAVCEELSEAYTQDSEPSPQPEPLVPLAETVLQALPGGVEESRDTLITDDIPSIPREEIPIGSAVETYTDSGIETVKISGTTYVVDDEPVAEASYAPINSEPASDALMWANGFEADVKARNEAEPEPEAKRPFWVFGKKELA